MLRLAVPRAARPNLRPTHQSHYPLSFATFLQVISTARGPFQLLTCLHCILRCLLLFPARPSACSTHTRTHTADTRALGPFDVAVC